MKEQRLTGILFLDRNLEISQSICTEEISEDIWQESFQNQNLQNIVLYPNRVLTDQVTTE